MPEGRAPISSSRIATGDIARHSFAVVRRGFDTDEVRAYLQSVSRSLEAFEEREQELRAAVAEAEERAAHPVVDEATLTASLGQHSAQILRHAHEEAARIVAQAQEGAATLAARDPEPGRRAAGAHRGRVGRARRRGGAAGGQRRAGGPRGERAHPRRGDGRRARRSSPGPRTRGGHCSSRCKRPAAVCWPTWRRGGGRSGSRSSSCVPPATKWRRPCSACATRWTGSWRHLERTDDEARAAAMAVGDQFRLHGATEGPPRPGRGGRARRGETPAPAWATGGTPGGRGRTTRGASGGHPLGRRAVRPHPCRDRGGVRQPAARGSRRPSLQRRRDG